MQPAPRSPRVLWGSVPGCAVCTGGSRAGAVLGALSQGQDVPGGPGDICAQPCSDKRPWFQPDSVCFPLQQRRGRAALQTLSLPGRRALLVTGCLSFPIRPQGRRQGGSGVAPNCCVLWHLGGRFGGAGPHWQCPGAGCQQTQAAPHGLAAGTRLSGAASCAGAQPRWEQGVQGWRQVSPSKLLQAPSPRSLSHLLESSHAGGSSSSIPPSPARYLCAG